MYKEKEIERKREKKMKKKEKQEKKKLMHTSIKYNLKSYFLIWNIFLDQYFFCVQIFSFTS